MIIHFTVPFAYFFLNLFMSHRKWSSPVVPWRPTILSTILIRRIMHDKRARALGIHSFDFIFRSTKKRKTPIVSQIAFALSTSVNRRRLSNFELTERSNWTATGDVFHFHFHSENGKSFSTSIQSKSVALTDTREDEATKRRYNFSIGQVNK